MSDTANGWIMLLLGIGLLGGGAVLVFFAGRALSRAQGRPLGEPGDPVITGTNSETGQTTRIGKGGLLLFVALGILVALAGVGLLAGAGKAFGKASEETSSASSASTAAPAGKSQAGHKANPPGNKKPHRAK
jgi:hypothetical protein